MLWLGFLLISVSIALGNYNIPQILLLFIAIVPSRYNDFVFWQIDLVSEAELEILTKKIKVWLSNFYFTCTLRLVCQ
jgi:hypothetical protein